MANSTNTPQSPEYGARLLHQTLDHLSKVSPDRLYASVPKTSDVSQGFRDITFQDMARCSDFIANWIESNIGRSKSSETVSYIGIPDLRSVAIFFGAVKCGYKVSIIYLEVTKVLRFSGSFSFTSESSNYECFAT
jgi:hypothetical protein